jgi:hypothetical protein
MTTTTSTPSTPPDEKPDTGSLPLPKWVLWAAIPGALAPILILVWIVITERAFDESKCPFVEKERRSPIEGAYVVEQARRCIDKVEERRFVLERHGKTQLLGERRFAPDAFAAGRYKWEARVSEQGEIQVRIDNEGHGHVIFRDGTVEKVMPMPGQPPPQPSAQPVAKP